MAILILFYLAVHCFFQMAVKSQLYEDLLYGYNRVPRPVKNSSDALIVHVGASLIRIIDIVKFFNYFILKQWYDAKLTWNPSKYGGIKTLHIPSDLIWIPDFVLYNNAVGDPDITIMTDALVAYDGRIYWRPPAIYKSFCPIDVTWFPYDLQSCEMKFGTWSYTGSDVDLKQLPKEVINGTDKHGQNVEIMEKGMDLSFFYQSAEWDLLSLSSARHSVLYTTCCGPEKYVDITYYFVLRRKTLFFTCNLIIPCFLISLLTTTVFYLSDHKITFSISILVTLTVFFLVLIDIIPPTSLVIPMFGRYLITTMILVSLSTIVSVITLNLRFRSGPESHMPQWIRSIFLNFLPKVLFMSRPKSKNNGDHLKPNHLVDPIALIEKKRWSARLSNGKRFMLSYQFLQFSIEIYAHLFKRAFKSFQFNLRMRKLIIIVEWRFVAMVLDRLFLIIFSILNIGAFLIILEAPSLHDTRKPMNITSATKPLGQASFIQ
ncbi:unnamed protein product [Dracunculus medinensis]|uniref:Neur_chan_LBD domain-containing protein n=1 Tax=Dracunculus medinensis TaxID=318479 RepID=A0A0N4U8C2_DRAME|nr:unnamed protein product [Dracunculus medinensis]